MKERQTKKGKMGAKKKGNDEYFRIQKIANNCLIYNTEKAEKKEYDKRM